MKKQILLFSILAAAACNPPAKQQAKISADLAGLKDSVVHIMIPVADSSKTDTVPVTNGHFTWTGEMTEPQKIYIGTSTRFIELFMGNNDVQVKGNIDSIENLQITGSPTQDEVAAFNRSIKDITDKMDTLFAHYEEAKKNDSTMALLEKTLDDLREQRKDRTVTYIRTHPESPVSVSMLSDMAVMGEYAPLDSTYRLLASSARESAAGKRVANRLAVLKRSAIGQPVIDFMQNDVDGKPVKISDFKGKYVLLDFWASWCGPCRAENPNVLKAYNTFKDKNFIVVGVSLDDNADKWKAAIKEDGMPWIQLSDLKGWRNAVAQEYGIQGIPYSLLIDPNGIIIAKELRGTKLHEKLASLLNNQKPTI
ncbi:Peroxiredoxin [Chitinophaga terrae (ex Kim and Jung 2007)]|uniref:Peroxiredoxin n=1 Tax=Chitinophaga terrae (ex Kim and Jung 2007) TaxID=408074 RepID=A0A1H4BSP5_9BACT|nr:TlpA disulfide reductase family protein [Chitinophaga terrae (ex Kim and Jung 2007)]MDQ0108682.1 peroxiredoxin [Chitinophaga terrae (ex Kim and Jung 2007)]GEP89752.1 thiol:disulfide interchange protein [Chitinophaga terrae (ex Kim and Jung 2007)]SEA51110.1 Peroxiredoxin [Chitinophaga terrae (ex Kim and Jung 2007)]